MTIAIWSVRREGVLRLMSHQIRCCKIEYSIYWAAKMAYNNYKYKIINFGIFAFYIIGIYRFNVYFLKLGAPTFQANNFLITQERAFDFTKRPKN
jgi:hypothetical protein